MSGSPSSRTETAAPRALVVENDLTSRELLARVLRLKGLDAHTAIGGAQAAALLLQASIPYDLLVVDLDLEPTDGVDLLRHVAGLPVTLRPQRIVALSQSLAPFYSRLAELRLPVETFQKPVHLPTLMKVVEAVIASDQSR